MIVVTGATGQLGRRVVESLREVVPADQVVAAVRHPDKAADLGVAVRHADYNEPATLVPALEGASKVLLISGNEMGRRVRQHQAVIEAATRAEVPHLVYTSAPRADTSTLAVVPEHRTTEEVLRASGLTFTILRNGWYNENFAPSIDQAVRTGTFVGSAGDGRFASAARADFAEAAVTVLTSEGHEDTVYELSGDTSWSYVELATMISEITGKEVSYVDLEPDEHRATLVAAGFPVDVAGFVVEVEQGTKAGLLGEVFGDARRLIGRPTTPMRATVAELVQSLTPTARSAESAVTR